MKFMYRVTFLFGLIFFFGKSCIAGQVDIDSIYRTLHSEKEDTNKVKTLNALSLALDKAPTFDSALACAREAQILAEKLDFKNGLARAYDIAAYICADVDNYPKSIEYEGKALAIYQSANDKDGVAREYHSMSTAYWKQGDFPKSMQYDFKAMGIYQETGNKRGLAGCYMGLGIIYSEQGNDSTSLTYYFKALAINIELHDPDAIAASYCDIGNSYDEMGNRGEALIFDFKALEIEKKLGHQRNIARNYGNIGNIYEELGNYPLALEFEFKALDIDTQVGYKRGTSSKMVSIGSIYTRLKKFKLARLYIDSALNVAKRINESEYVKNAYGELANLDEVSGDYKNGLKDYKTYTAYRDSLINRMNTKKMVQTEMNFEFQQKEATGKAEQDKKDAVADLKSKKEAVIRNSLIGASVLMMALVFFILQGYRQKQRANAIINLQKIKVEQKQKEILDSLNYAETIQKALLASDSLLSAYLPEYFVLYKPKDIVSGDFYWATVKNEMLYLAVCDSTGHGVPGAFMSLLNISFLNEAITEKNLTRPNEVLNHTRNKLIESLSHKGRQDGMDGVIISLPVKGENAAQMSFSGAYNTMLVIRDGNIIELNVDKMPVGASPKQGESFTLQNFQLRKGDSIYAFTDGYADQFGGEKGKKFKYRQLLQQILSVSKSAMHEQKRMLEEVLEKWQGNLEQVDDILIMGIRV